MIIKNGLMMTETLTFQKQNIAFDSYIQEIGDITKSADVDADGYYLIPGLVDIHTHGALGCDSSDGSTDGIRHIADYYAAHGVTSFCATTMTLNEDVLTKAVQSIRRYTQSDRSARCLGIYLEGPFLSYAKRGAQSPDGLYAPDIAMFHRLSAASDNLVKMVGIAPELPGAFDFIRAVSRECAVSVAHTTADYKTAMQAYACGATNVTHLFNGMAGLHHREPSVVGAAYDSNAYAELICDGYHVHPSVVRIAFKLFGEKLILVSDSLRSTGMPDGSYDLGGQLFTMDGGKATLADGTIAGSAITLLQAVQNAISFGIAPAMAINAATLAPARVIGMDQDVGSLSIGKKADMLLLDSNFHLAATIINGKVVNHEIPGI